MLMAHPAVLRDLIDQYEALTAVDADEADSAQVRQRVEDVAYTLCVSTGTRDIEMALETARHQLPARTMDGPVLNSANPPALPALRKQTPCMDATAADTAAAPI